MSRSAGPGSPVVFKCSRGRAYCWSLDDERTQREQHALVSLTGRWRRNRPPAMHALGVRNSYFSVEYQCQCQCGHVGWSNHVTLAIRATKEGVIPPDRAVEDYRLERYIPHAKVKGSQ